MGTKTVRAALWVVLAVTLTGCASTSGSTMSRDYNIITSAEIAEAAPRVTTLYQLVERLRPRWLEARSPRSMGGGASIAVVQGQSVLGGVAELRQFGSDYASWLEYLDAAEAGARFGGMSHMSIGGAIVIHLNPRR